jgi:hypothetical protein
VQLTCIDIRISVVVTVDYRIIYPPPFDWRPIIRDLLKYIHISSEGLQPWTVGIFRNIGSSGSAVLLVITEFTEQCVHAVLALLGLLGLDSMPCIAVILA